MKEFKFKVGCDMGALAFLAALGLLLYGYFGHVGWAMLVGAIWVGFCLLVVLFICFAALVAVMVANATTTKGVYKKP